MLCLLACSRRSIADAACKVAARRDPRRTSTGKESQILRLGRMHSWEKLVRVLLVVCFLFAFPLLSVMVSSLSVMVSFRFMTIVRLWKVGTFYDIYITAYGRVSCCCMCNAIYILDIYWSCPCSFFLSSSLSPRPSRFSPLTPCCLSSSPGGISFYALPAQPPQDSNHYKKHENTNSAASREKKKKTGVKFRMPKMQKWVSSVISR